jgi:hypothetical protein
MNTVVKLFLKIVPPGTQELIGWRRRSQISSSQPEHHLLASTPAGYTVAVVPDLFSRNVVDWAISESLTMPLVADALKRSARCGRSEVGEVQLPSAAKRNASLATTAFNRFLSFRALRILRRGNW